VILPEVRDPRLITIRRGGTLTDEDHHHLALWAAACAEHVLPLFETAVPDDPRPRQAIAAVRAWVHGEMRMMQSRAAGGHAMGAARPLRGAPRFAAYAAGQAACVPHVAEHDLGAAAYAIRAAEAAAPARGGGRGGTGRARVAAGAAARRRARAGAGGPAAPQRPVLAGLLPRQPGLTRPASYAAMTSPTLLVTPNFSRSRLT